MQQPQPIPNPSKTNLIGHSLDDLTALMVRLEQPKFRAKQLYGWIYNKGVTDFDQMHNISKPLQHILNQDFSLSRPEIAVDQLAMDGTRKFLLNLDAHAAAEMVYIPEENRGTLCISSQVGCSLTCLFCHTGTQKLVRNLTAGEIVAQLMLAKDRLGDWGDQQGKQQGNPQNDMDENDDESGFVRNRQITNIVFMGMGEPLYNTDEVIAAIKLFTDGNGLSLTKRRVTVSTSGVVPEIHKLGAETSAPLAVSLHAVNDELRDQLVPINRKYKLDQLMDSLRDYPSLSNARRITFEYIMLSGVNDSDQQAKALARLIAGIPAKINLIPFNPWPGSNYEPSPLERQEAFLAILRKAGYTATLRKTRGQDILAACGQLKSESMRISKRQQQEINQSRIEKESILGI